VVGEVRQARSLRERRAIATAASAQIVNPGPIEAGTMLMRGAGRPIIGAGAVTATND